jgi:arsenate reductase
MAKKLKVYEYSGCSTCKKALKFLESRKIPFEKVDITAQPPSKSELQAMLRQVGELRKLFNTSGQVYKELKLSEKLPSLSTEEALALLAKNGRLVKRPFILGEGWGAVGFKEEDWKKHL